MAPGQNNWYYTCVTRGWRKKNPEQTWTWSKLLSGWRKKGPQHEGTGQNNATVLVLQKLFWEKIPNTWGLVVHVLKAAGGKNIHNTLYSSAKRYRTCGAWFIKLLPYSGCCRRFSGKLLILYLCCRRLAANYWYCICVAGGWRQITDSVFVLQAVGGKKIQNT